MLIIFIYEHWNVQLRQLILDELNGTYYHIFIMNYVYVFDISINYRTAYIIRYLCPTQLISNLRLSSTYANRDNVALARIHI